MSFLRRTGLALLLGAGLAVVAVDFAEARVGGGRSLGSRGSRTYNAPPPTNTAPGVAPIDRSMTQRGAPTMAQNPRSGIAGAAQPSRFGGWRGLLMGGLFVAALGGIFGFGALASVVGFLLQFALIAVVVYLVLGFFRNRNQPATARPVGRGFPGWAQTGAPNGGAAGAYGGAANSPSTPINIGQADLDAFERLLSEIQTAYGREDIEQLGAKTTPEILSHFLEELSEQEKRGVRNQISEVKLLQGDLAEAWSENRSDYATVALRYALKDVTLDRATGRVVAGDASRPTEATELWTFRRDHHAPAEGWQLSAIQQTA